MWNIDFGRKIALYTFLLFITFMFPLFTSAAEVLQVTDSSTLLIGDQNRTYTVKIACLEVSPSQDKSVITFLRSELPRHSRVNLRPKGAKDGVLISKVISIENKNDIGAQIVSKDLARSTC